MSFGTNEEHAPFVSVVAIVTNQTNLAWKEIPLEARFFDRTGTLIDVARGYYGWALYPKSDAAIRIQTDALRPFADYDSYKIYVGYAHDAHARF